MTITSGYHRGCKANFRPLSFLILAIMVTSSSLASAEVWVKISVSPSSEPYYIYMFSNHYDAPWYGQWSISKRGLTKGIRPRGKGAMFEDGDGASWTDISGLVRDRGVLLNLSLKKAHNKPLANVRYRLAFASSPEDADIYKIYDVEQLSDGFVVYLPKYSIDVDLSNAPLSAAELAAHTGSIADNFQWPKIGKFPTKIPFFVGSRLKGRGVEVSTQIKERELRTLGYFGFTNNSMHFIQANTWRAKEQSYLRPQANKIRKIAERKRQQFLKGPNRKKQLSYVILSDEPKTQSDAFIQKDAAYSEAFINWLKTNPEVAADRHSLRYMKKPRFVDKSHRDENPELFYFSQKFKSWALSQFMVTQKDIIEDVFEQSMPVVANFSDSATYRANMYGRGVDYFVLMEDGRQNALLSEDWVNAGSTSQLGAYNVELMRAAVRTHGQILGHYLIAYSNRKPWDIKLKAASETARDVRLWRNFWYGPTWSRHEGGPPNDSHAWYARPELWSANAEVVRELGEAEDLLVDAKVRPSKVGIVYSSAADIWSEGVNHAAGFNRMHTWLALSHKQVQSDFIGERHITAELLSKYKVLYISGEHLHNEAVNHLMHWVESGGVLVLSAGAVSKDQFNRPLVEFQSWLQVERKRLVHHQVLLKGSKNIERMTAKTNVRLKGESSKSLEVLGLLQELQAAPNAKVLASFDNDKPASLKLRKGKGSVYVHGFLPALDYIKKALVHRTSVAAQGAAASKELARSNNPWVYDADVRNFIVRPVAEAGLRHSILVSHALVDAVVSDATNGLVIPLANYSLSPQKHVEFQVDVKSPVKTVRSVYHGDMKFNSTNDGRINFSMPLDATDYIQIYYR